MIVTGLVLDAEGRKMSKRIGTVADPWRAVERHGADALRLYLLASSQVWLPKRFDAAAVAEVAGASLHRLRNTYGFFGLYAEGWTPEAAPPPVSRAPADRWLLDRLDDLVGVVRAAWDGFDVTTGVRALLDFCDNALSNWYVRTNRGRFWAPDATADAAALATLYEALVTVTRLLAPAAAFLSDAIHRRLAGRAVQLERVPAPRGGREETLPAGRREGGRAARHAGRQAARLGIVPGLARGHELLRLGPQHDFLARQEPIRDVSDRPPAHPHARQLGLAGLHTRRVALP